jgi:hypothetical protein
MKREEIYLNIGLIICVVIIIVSTIGLIKAKRQLDDFTKNINYEECIKPCEVLRKRK